MLEGGAIYVYDLISSIQDEIPRCTCKHNLFAGANETAAVTKLGCSLKIRPF